MIASLSGVVVAPGSLLGQSIGLADRGVQVDSQRPVAGAGPGSPGPPQQFPAHPVQLAHMAPAEAAQEGPQVGWSLDHATQYRGGPARTQHVGVVNAVATGQRRGHQGLCHHLVARVGSRWGQEHLPGQGDGQRVHADPGAGPVLPEGAARHWPPDDGRRRICGCARGAQVVASIECSLF